MARTGDFQELVHDLAHAGGGGRSAVSCGGKTFRRPRLKRSAEIARARALAEGKPEKILDKIVEGRLAKYYEEVCLLEQPFIRENTTSIADVIKTRIAKLGENISVTRFVRFKEWATWRGRKKQQPQRARNVAKYQSASCLLKLSGEVMAGHGSFGVDPARVKALAEEVSEVARAGVQIGLSGGRRGNFFRGVAAAAQDMDRVTADHMGMLSTVINALALQDSAREAGYAHARHDGHHDE